MPSKVFNAAVALNNYLENAVPIAIKNASEKITKIYRKSRIKKRINT